MAKRDTTFDYEMLVRYMLPQGILDSFEITKAEEEITKEKDETGTVIRILHIWLEERDLRDKEWHDLRPNGFTEYRAFNDFPQREHKVLLHVRRRRWLDSEGRSVILDTPRLTAEGTNYSAEFAGFLKKMVGYLPCDGPMRGAILPD
jgi:hypothetical protein